jgi:nickel-dependent lactate racemase
LEPGAPRGAADPGRVIARAVDFPLDGPPLDELARGRQSAVIVVPDATRRADLPRILPVVLSRLLAAGVPRAATTVLVACGTHPQEPDDRIAALVGPMHPAITIRQHDSRAREALSGIGELRPGVPLRIDREAVETDLLLTIGAVRHHYFAGFGGGPKMVVPGIAGHDEIQANHSLVLDRTENGWARHPGCEPGRLSGNPVAEEIARAADLRPPDMAICLVPGRNGGISAASAGSWRSAFGDAVARVRDGFELDGGRFRHLVAGAGGTPCDASLIQAHKALDAVCRFAEPGAEVLFVSELGAGAGSPAMADFLDDPEPQSILDRLAESYVQYGHTTLRIIEKTARFRIFLRSELDPELARRLGFIPVEDLDDIANRWRAEGVEDRVAVMANGLVWPRSGQLEPNETRPTGSRRS